jgi:hypothetical protein
MVQEKSFPTVSSGTFRGFVLGTLLHLAALGCSRGGAPLGEVRGTVKLDGKPVPQALVTFQPTGNVGTYSAAYTDASGEYRLVYSRTRHGAWVGEHEVTISTAVEVADENGRTKRNPERIPARYNKRTELIRQVSARANRIDFDLESSGIATQAAKKPGP